MEIVYKNIDELIPYENNPRINDESVEYVKNSIKEFGFKVPIVIDKNNVIIAGHTRYKASKELGLIEVPCIVANDLTEEQVKAFRLADNKVGEKSEWDYDLLQEELENILNIDMEQFDFELLPEEDGGFEEKEEENEEEDIVPESTVYIGAVSLFGKTIDTICCFDIDENISQKVLDFISKNNEEDLKRKIIEVLNDL